MHCMMASDQWPQQQQQHARRRVRGGVAEVPVCGVVKKRRICSKRAAFIDVALDCHPHDETPFAAAACECQLLLKDCSTGGAGTGGDKYNKDSGNARQRAKRVKVGERFRGVILHPMFEKSGQKHTYECAIYERENTTGHKTQLPPQPVITSRADNVSTVICKHFLKSGSCSVGGCQYRHVWKSEAERVHALSSSSVLKSAAMLQENKQYETYTKVSDSVDQQGGESKQRIHSKVYRAQLFADWISQNLGLEASRKSGKTILDIAGGQGLLSHYLQERHGFRSTIIDPQGKDGSGSRSRKRKRKRARQREAPEVRHIPKLFLFPFVKDAMENVLDSTSKASASASGSGSPSVIAMGLDASFVRECIAIVGLHPDEATEAILDSALSFQKPFAIVPCCVFPSKFPHRKYRVPVLEGAETEVEEEKSVVSYTDFCEYLMQKALTIYGKKLRVSFLPMKGRNRVLWWKPERERKQ